MFDDITNSPLTWPATWPRTERHRRSRSSFGAHSIAGSIHALQAEIRRMGGRHLIVSSNLRVRGDGLPYSNQRQPDDLGVAAYFTWRNKPIVFACDRWLKVEDNLWAIVKHIEALRGQERWGVGSLDQAFAGYAALPAPGETAGESWWSVLGLDRSASLAEIKSAYRALVKQHHPDAGGDPVIFDRIQRAYEDAPKSR